MSAAVANRARVPEVGAGCVRADSGEKNRPDDPLLARLVALSRGLLRFRAGQVAISARADAAGEAAGDLHEVVRGLAELLFGAECAGHLNRLGLFPRGSVSELALAPVAQHFEPVRLTDGSFAFRFNFGQEPIVLSPLLGELLIFLSEAEPDAGDGVARWRTRPELLSFLHSRNTGRSYRPQYVCNLIHVLRRRLKQHAGLLQWHRQHGWRLAVRGGARGSSSRAPVPADSRPVFSGVRFSVRGDAEAEMPGGVAKKS